MYERERLRETWQGRRKKKTNERKKTSKLEDRLGKSSKHNGRLIELVVKYKRKSVEQSTRAIASKSVSPVTQGHGQRRRESSSLGHLAPVRRRCWRRWAGGETRPNRTSRFPIDSALRLTHKGFRLNFQTVSSLPTNISKVQKDIIRVFHYCFTSTVQQKPRQTIT